MNEDFYQHILERQQSIEAIPPNEIISSWAVKLLHLLFPEQSKKHYSSAFEVKEAFAQLEKFLVEILNNTQACKDCNKEATAKRFFNDIPFLYDLLNKDATAIFNGDPAAISIFEVIRSYPGFFAISFYRIANRLYKMDIPLVPRILTEYAHAHTGIDIHPSAEIGEYFCIDHGTGIVIGETTIIGNHVKLYQGVTLGGISISKDMANTKRHPTVEDHVIIYSGATILGGDTVIGHHSIIGGNVWLTRSVPANSTVYHKPQMEVVENKVIQ